MTIGKSSKKNKALGSPAFLDRASGFYGRLDETEAELMDKGKITEQQPTAKPGARQGNRIESSAGIGLPEEQDHDFSEGMLEDDGATLLKRKPSRLSQRWSRISSRKTKTEKPSLEVQNQSPSTESKAAPSMNLNVLLETEVGSNYRASESMVVHFSAKENSDDQILITEQKEKQWETDKMRRERELEKEDIEKMKVMKRSSLRNYRKVLDKALRRGWETFVTNLYSVTLTSVSSSSFSPSLSKSEMNRKDALADFR